MNSKTAMLICFSAWFRVHLAQLRCNLSLLPSREHSQCFLFGNMSCTAAVPKFKGEGHIFWKLVNTIYQFWNQECASRLISQHQTHSKQKKNGQQNSIIILILLSCLISELWFKTWHCYQIHQVKGNSGSPSNLPFWLRASEYLSI